VCNRERVDDEGEMGVATFVVKSQGKIRKLENGGRKGKKQAYENV
jgi:hypothetical protein